jgi:hypothetical protein
MKNSFIGLLLVGMSAAEFTYAQSYDRVLQCNNSALVVDRIIRDGAYGESQVVIRDRGVVDYFKRQFGYLYTNHEGHYVERTFAGLTSAEFQGRLDLTEEYVGEGPEQRTFPSLIVERRGAGLLVELMKVTVGVSGGFYDETSGTWRDGSSYKNVKKVTDWYFEGCSK